MTETSRDSTSSVSDPSTVCLPESQTDTSLPMVVNLRGDEDFVEDFAVDAQEAMSYLGIKRSRLTQISGRELRVGRIRKDRYLRPVYRQKDLEDYRRWTRSTASHQSSSLVLEHAIHKLEQQCQEFERVTKDNLQDSLEDLLLVSQKELGLQIERVSQRLQSGLQSHGSSLQKTSQHTHLQLSDLKNDQKKLANLLQLLQGRQELNLEILSELHQVIREASVSLGDLREVMRQLLEDQRKSLRDLQQTLMQDLQDTAERQNHSELRMEDSINRISEQMETLRQEMAERYEKLEAGQNKIEPMPTQISMNDQNLRWLRQRRYRRRPMK